MDAAAVAEARAYLRVADTSEDAVIAGLLESALALGERFTGGVLVARTVVETLAPTGGWQRLTTTPVRAVTAVEGLSSSGTAVALPPTAYAIDLDGHGSAHVRVTDAGGARRVRVAMECGLATDWAGLPQSIRQGAIRLVAHLFAHRDVAMDPGPPAAVASLWRPYRRMRLA